MFVKATLEVAFTILLHDEADIGGMQIGAEFEIAAHTRHVSRRQRTMLCLKSHLRYDKYRAPKISYRGCLIIFEDPAVRISRINNAVVA